MKPVTIDERKRIQLLMLDEIDLFCRKNGIKYSLAFGTLLGAVRHSGFIPWDDDVDIMMPLPDMLLFKEKFISANITYVDVDNDKHHGYAFSRLAYKKTVCKEGLVAKSIGVCIDLYIVIGLPENDEAFFSQLTPLYNKRMTFIKWRSLFLTIFPIRSIPFYSKVMRAYRDFLFNNCRQYDQAQKFYIIAGPLNIRNKMIYDKDIFNNLEELVFEGKQYQAISSWDYFLTLRYGDYMKLPPLEERCATHSYSIFWK